MEETLRVEYERIKKIKVHCKYCNRELAEFDNIKVTSKNWKLKEIDIDWDVEYTIKSKKVFWKCANIFATVVQYGIFHINKKVIKLKY